MDGLEQDRERSLLCAAVSVSGTSVLRITTQGPRAGEGTKRVCEAGAWPLQDPQEMTLLDPAHPDLHTSSTGVPSDEVLTSFSRWGYGLQIQIVWLALTFILSDTKFSFILWCPLPPRGQCGVCVLSHLVVSNYFVTP